MDNTTPKYPAPLTAGTCSGRVGGLPDLRRNSNAMNHDPIPQPNLSPELMMQEQHRMLQQQHRMQMQQMQNQQPQKLHNRTKAVAALCALFLGGLGAHKFYLGQVGWGVLYLLFSWTFIPVFVAFIEIVIYLTQSDEAFDRAHNYK